jgi:hypothetical protein
MVTRRKRFFVVCVLGMVLGQIIAGAGIVSAGSVVSNEYPIADPVVGPAPDSQQGAALTKSGSGFVAVWWDARFNGLVASRVGTDGSVLDVPPVDLNAGSRSVDVASNGSGYLVGYMFNSSVYVLRLSESLAVIGSPILVATSGVFGPSIASNGTDYLVSWSSTSATTGIDIRARRVTAAGTLPDAQPIEVSTAPHSQNEVKVSEVGSDYVAVWTDGRSWDGVTGLERDYIQIRAARITSAGVVLDPDAVALTPPAFNSTISIATSPTNLLVTFRGPGGASAAILSHDLTSVGSAVPVGSTAFVTSTDSHYDGTAYRMTWTNWTALPAERLSMRRIDTSGTLVDAAPTVLALSSTSMPPVDVETVDGTTLTSFQKPSGQGGDMSIFGIRLSGASILDTAPFVISRGVAAEISPTLDWDGSRFFVVWQQCCDASTGEDLFGAFVEPDGDVGDPITISASHNQEHTPKVAWSGTQHLVVWPRWDGGLYGARVLADGTVADSTPVTIATGFIDWGTWDVVWDGDSFVVAWSNNADVFAARVGPDGVVLDSPPISVATGAQQQRVQGIASNGSSTLITYSDSGTTTARGVLLEGGVAGTSFDTTSGSGIWGAAASDGAGYLVGSGRYVRRITADGSPTAGEVDFGASYSVKKMTWHGTHWVVVLGTGSFIEVRLMLPDGTLDNSQPFFSGTFGGNVGLATGPGDRTAVALSRAAAAEGSSAQVYVRFVDSIPAVSIQSPSDAIEGNSGSTNATFAVRLRPASNRSVTVDYATVPGTATAGDDYAHTSGTLTFAPGESTKNVDVPISGDTAYEGNETFRLSLSNIVGAAPSSLSSSAFSILNDDAFDADGDGWSTPAGDADDNDATIYPGAPELCDGKDNDQDLRVDEESPDADSDGIADCMDPDDDGDGLPDGQDPDVISSFVGGLPAGSFASKGHRSAIQDRLEKVEASIKAGEIEAAVTELQSLRLRVDGCNGSTNQKADKNDWITRCSDQRAVRDLIDELIGAL